MNECIATILSRGQLALFNKSLMIFYYFGITLKNYITIVARDILVNYNYFRIDMVRLKT